MRVCVCVRQNKSNLLAAVPVQCDFIALAVGKEMEMRMNVPERKR